MTALDDLDVWLTDRVDALEWDFDAGEVDPLGHTYQEAPDRDTLIERLDVYRVVQEQLEKVKAKQ